MHLTELEKAEIGKKLISFALLLCFLEPPAALGWGNEGHTYVNQVAAQNIPSTMPHFLRQAVKGIAYLGPEPDRWRSPSEYALKNAQEPDHFIDLERIEWLKPLPPGAMSSIASSTKSVPPPRTIPMTIFRSASVCSLTSRWKFLIG